MELEKKNSLKNAQNPPGSPISAENWKKARFQILGLKSGVRSYFL